MAHAPRATKSTIAQHMHRRRIRRSSGAANKFRIEWLQAPSRRFPAYVLRRAACEARSKNTSCSILITPQKGYLLIALLGFGRLWISAYAHAVQRLYSMFPAGVPGFALFVLRCCIAAALAGTAFPSGWQHVAFLCLLCLLFLGLLTPIVCGVAILSVIFDLSQVRYMNAFEI